MATSSPAAILADGCIQLGLKMPIGGSDRLLQYLELMLKWNRTHNLTALGSIPEMVTKHLLDSLSVTPWLPSGRVIDIGSGAGLPGVPLAILSPQQPFTLLDASFKRVAFLQEVKRRLQLDNVTAVHSRAETYTADSFDVITCRAFAALVNMLDSSQALLAEGGCWLAMKGQLQAGELAAVPAAYRVASIQELQVPGLDASRHLLRIVRAGTEELPVTAPHAPPHMTDQGN